MKTVIITLILAFSLSKAAEVSAQITGGGGGGGGTATPGGSTTQIQFNNGGSLAGNAALTFDNGYYKILKVNNGVINTYFGPQTGTGLSDNFDYGAAALRIMADMGSYYGMYFYGTGDTYWGPSIEMPKSRSTDGTTHVIVQNGDQLGAWRMYGDDGANFQQAGQIEIAVDGTPGTSDMPTRIAFSTTADGASTWTERLRIDNAGNIIYAAKLQTNLGTPTNGSMVYCSDCTITNPCAGGGTGAFAKRLNGVWVCN